MAVALDTILQRHNEALFTVVDGHGLMLNIDAGAYHSVNGVGLRIWELLEAPQSSRSICDRLIEEYDVTRESCHAAVIGFLGELDRRGLIRLADTVS